MAFKRKETERPVPREDITPVTSDQQRALLEEKLIADPRKMETMSNEEIVEIAKLYAPSTPIKIPNEKLDPNYEYRWINKALKNWRRRRGTGWTPITEQGEYSLTRFLKKGVSVDEIHMGTHYDTGSGALSLGNDLILCFILKKVAVAIRASLSDRLRSQQRAARSAFHEASKLAGVEAFDTEG